MINVKKWLAALMTAAMVFTSAGINSIAVFAQDAAPAYADQTTDATITITGKSGAPFDYTVKSFSEFSQTIRDAQKGDAIVVKGTVKLESNVVLNYNLTGEDTITLDLTGAKVWSQTGSEAIVPGEGISEYESPSNQGFFTYSEEVFAADNLVIDFPKQYSPDTAKYGVAASYTMVSGETVKANLVDDEGDITNNNDVYLDVEPASNATLPTCTKAGTAKLSATAVGIGGITVTKDKDYGEIAALGHTYGTVKDGVIALNTYKVGDYTPNDGVQIYWAIRGSGGNLNVSKSADGYTAIESLQTKCLNEYPAHGIGTAAAKLEDAKSYTIKEAKVGTAATSREAGSTIYTIEIVTADDVTITVKQTVYDIPALEATNVGLIKEVGFKSYTYTQNEDGTYTQKSANPVYPSQIYADYTETEAATASAPAVYTKTVINEDNSVDYQITYADAYEPSKTGYVSGNLPACTDTGHKTVTYTCGHNTYYYKPIKITAISGYDENYNNVSTNIVTIGANAENTAVVDENVGTGAIGTQKSILAGNASNYFKAVASGAHTYDMNNGEYNITVDATTYSTGTAIITCKYCNTPNVEAVVPMLTTGVKYELKEAVDGDYFTEDLQVAQADNNGIWVKEPTCTDDGYSYYWSADTRAEAATTDAAGNTHKYNGAMVKIAGTEKSAIGHDWYISKQADAVWNGTTECAITYTCNNDNSHTKTITYFSGNGTDTENFKYNAISTTVIPGEDCSKKNKIAYTVDGVTDIMGGKVQTMVTDDSHYGTHNFVDEINWSADGKKATVTRTCQNAKCGEHYNVSPQVVTAAVTGEMQDDGSTLYTAKYDGEEIGTKKVFDLTGDKVKVIVNGGEPVDENKYDWSSKSKIPEIVVTINDVEISSDLYVVDTLSYAEGANNLASFTIYANEDEPEAFGQVEAVYTILGYESFVDGVFTIDDEDAYDFGDSSDDIIYDGEAHTFVVTEVYGSGSVSNIIKKTTVEYATVPQGKTVKDPLTLTYADSLELKDLGDYDVYVKLSADGYTTFARWITSISVVKDYRKDVNVYIDNASVVEGDKPNLHVRVVSASGSDEGEELNVDLADFNIMTVGGETLENLKVGTYQLVATSEKYHIRWDSNQLLNGCMGTLTVLAKDSSTAEDQAKAEAATALINALTDSSSVADVTAARAAYDALSDTAKKRVDADVVKKLEAAEAAATSAVLAELQAVTDDTAQDVAAKAVNDYNALSAAQKAAVQKDAAAVAGLNKASAISGVEIAGKAASKISVKTSKLTIKRKKAKKIAVTKTGNGKVTFTNKSTKAVKKVIKVSSAGKIKVTKKAKKGKIYKVKVQASIAGTATYKPAKSKVKTIKIKVK